MELKLWYTPVFNHLISDKTSLPEGKLQFQRLTFLFISYVVIVIYKAQENTGEKRQGANIKAVGHIEKQMGLHENKWGKIQNPLFI